MVRKIREDDREAYLEMAEDFYSSDAVCHKIPRRHFEAAFQELMRSREYAEAYFLEYGNQTAGYALLAKTFSQEAGGMVVWIEELYVKPEFRGCGLGHEFFAHLKEHLPADVKRVRLEAEPTNQKAISLYRRLGFEDLPYCQMIREE
ncbi:GNAT family N-acetyltransferase [Caproicibacter sp.]|uniref:GNAT family N-acetyltransferase n=1 Tax=Caproicibacter sp. TaxID=2814884 RepID=UPI003989FB51